MGAVQQELLEEMADVDDWKPEKPLAGEQEHEELGRAGEAEEILQGEQKEAEGDEQKGQGGAESDREEQRCLNEGSWTRRFQHEVAEMAEDLRSEAEGQFVGGANLEANQTEEPDFEAGNEGVQPAGTDSAESEEDQQGRSEGEARSSAQWEPKEMVTLEVQEEEPKGVAEKGDGQQRGLEGAEMGEPHQRELEAFVRHEGTQQKEQEENEGDEEEAASRAEYEGEEQKGLKGAAWIGRFQHEAAKMVANLQSEPGEKDLGGANMEDSQQEEPAVEAGVEGVQPSVPDSAERGTEEAEARNTSQWEPEETVTLEVQEEDPKGVAETGDGQQRGLEGAEMEELQQRELEVFVRNEGTQHREQEESERREPETPGRAESDGELNGAAWTGRFLHEATKMAENLWSEPDRELVGGAKMEASQQEAANLEAGDEGVQKAPGSAKSDQKEKNDPEGEAEARSSPWWDPDKEEATDGGESLTEEQRGDGTARTGTSQQEGTKMVEGQLLEAEGLLTGEGEAEYQQGKPDVETGDEGALQAMLDGAETKGAQQGEQEVEERDLLWEPEETLEQHPERRNGYQQGLEETDKQEGHRNGKLEGLVRNEAETEEEEKEQEEQMREAGLQRDQQTVPEALVGITVLEEVVIAKVMEEPEVQGQEPRETEGTKRHLLQEPMGHQAPVDTCCLAGAGAFPDEVPSLDTSAQKERVLLRRKSSIRRAPSLKRPKPPTETPPQQETGTEETSPPQPRPSGGPNLRHAGFGLMHPTMMAELQMRLRRPQ